MHDETRELGRRLAAGEESAYAELYDRFGPALFGAATRILGRQQDAEDAVQEVFAALVRYRNSLASVDDLPAYVFALLRRTAGRLAKTQSRDASVEVGDVAGHDPPDPAELEAAELLRLAVDRLQPEHREIIALKIDAGLTFEQIGQLLGINHNTAASRYRYALAKLRDMLKARS